MKIIKRFYEEDLRELVAEKLGVEFDDVTATYTEESVGYGLEEHYEPIFYLEVESDERRQNS